MNGLRIVHSNPFVPKVEPVPAAIADKLRAYLKKIEWKEEDGGCFCGGYFINGPSIRSFLSDKQ